jgi:PDDEXK-like domain of unknown function (DUF3799)
MKWPLPGIHEGVPFELYRSDDITTKDDKASVIGKAVSKSLITSFAPDPGAWKSSPPKVSTKAMKSGSLLDCLLTTPDEMDLRYRVSPFDSFRTNEAKAWREGMENRGIEVITQDQIDNATAQSNAIITHPVAGKLILGSRRQVAFRHRTKYGFDAKGLIDIVPEDNDTLVDLKTCEPGALESKRSLQRHIFDWEYHVQAGAYCEGFSIAAGEERTKFKFIFVSSKVPFRVAVIALPLAAIIFGADQYRAGMKRFAECIETDIWPSIWDDEVELDLPQYAYSECGEP